MFSLLRTVQTCDLLLPNRMWHKVRVVTFLMKLNKIVNSVLITDSIFLLGLQFLLKSDVMLRRIALQGTDVDILARN